MAHPLFPLQPDEREFPIEWIGISREENGVWVTAPELFTASELQELRQITEKYGGGFYELTARHGGGSGRQHWSKKIKIRLPGPPKSLDGMSPSSGYGPAPTAMAAPAASSGTEAVLLAVLQMSAQQQAATMQFMSAMMTSFMSNAKGDQAAIVNALSQMSSSDKATMAQFFQALAAVRPSDGSSGGGVDSFMRGVEFMRQFNGGGEASGGDSLAETLATVVAGMQAAAALKTGAPPPAMAAPPQPAAPPQRPPNAPPPQPAPVGQHPAPARPAA